MHIKCLPVGQLETNCYIVAEQDTLECAVIDPGDESNTVLDYLEEHKLICRYIFLTHGHYDHHLAAAAVSEETNAPIYVHPKDVGELPYGFPPVDGTAFYAEGDVLRIGSLEFRVMETPGHSPGSVILACGDALFTGDTLFRGSCGRTDLPGGSARDLLRSLRRIGGLGRDFEVYPGHMDSSTLERELRFNQYMGR